MFSVITMASSTTKPTASTTASMESTLMEKPARYMTKKSSNQRNGITIHGTSVTRQSRKKRKNDDDNQHKASYTRLLHLVDRARINFGIVKTVVVMNVFGKVFLHLFPCGHIRRWLFQCGWHPVVELLRHLPWAHRSSSYNFLMSAGPSSASSNVAETDNTVTVPFRDKIVELFGRMHQTQRTDGELGSVSSDTAGRELYVSLSTAFFTSRGGFRQPDILMGVQPKPHGIALFSPDAYTTYI